MIRIRIVTSLVVRANILSLGFKNVQFKPDLSSQLLFYPYPVNGNPGTDYGDWCLYPCSAGVHEYIFKNGYFPTPPISTAIVDFTNGMQVTIISNGNINSVDAVTRAYTKIVGEK